MRARIPTREIAEEAMTARIEAAIEEILRERGE